jgi:FkbM family methyltransferase
MGKGGEVMSVVNVTLKLPRGDREMRFNLDPAHANEELILSYFGGGQLYEPDVAAVLLRAIQPGDSVLDIGANIGVFTVLASALAGPEGRVVGFEPAPDNLERLAANLALNDSANVTVVGQPASDRIGPVTLHLSSDDDGRHSLWNTGKHPDHQKSRENPRSIVTTTTTIDSEMARLALAPPRLIKIDTEGAEHRVLAGAIELLMEFEIPYIVAELHEFGLEQLGSSQGALRGFMANLGYDTFLLYHDGSLPKLVPRGTLITSKFFLNVLFSRLDDVAALWKVETHHPGATAPIERAV